ncbi:MAG: 4-hydroxy-3-methylbut-2-enyl diphosphate reductase [bacterium]
MILWLNYRLKSKSTRIDYGQKSGMKIIISKKAGFCQGVKRALDLAISETTQSDEPVFTFGPLVHNNQVISYLEDLGIERIDRIEDLPPGSHIIVRSHGIGPKDFEKIQARNLTIVDGTCGKVKTVQNIAKGLFEKGYKIIILGAPKHPEIKAIREYVNDEALVINSLDDIKNPLFEKIPEKIGLVCQTTLSHAFFDQAVEKIKAQIPHIEIHNTICGATSTLQKEARSVAEKVDLMIVIGSPESSNTAKLAELSVEITRMHRIERHEELDESWFTKGMKIGITAGASSPAWVIKDVINRLMEIGRKLDGKVEVENASQYLVCND